MLLVEGAKSLALPDCGAADERCTREQAKSLILAKRDTVPRNGRVFLRDFCKTGVQTAQIQ